jgi:putative redox protein
MADSYKAAFDQTQAALRQEPDGAAATFTSESKQVAGLVSKAAVRQFELTVDEPEQLGGTDQGPNPVELVLAALGTCQEITYRLYADAMGIPVSGISVKLDGHLDLRGFFNVDPSIRSGYEQIDATVTIDSPASDADLARLKAAVDAHCPVLDIISKPVPVNLKMARSKSASAA